MLAITKRLIDPQRRCPWPDNVMFCDFEHYVDTGTWVQELHQTALHLTQAQTPAVDATLVPAPTAVALEQTTEQSHPVLAINDQAPRRLFVVDNFYVDPDAVRRFALAQEFQADIRWYKGQRTLRCFRSEWIRRRFESIIGQPILKWDHGMNGVFQITTAEDPQVYHNDLQTWAAMIYLTPDAPLQSGTRLHRSRYNHARHSREDHAIIDQAFQGGFYDSTKFDIVDDIGNVFNRLVIMDARHIHSAGAYFGNNAETGRLIHLFFFD